jgi:hypothetical protein
MADKPDIKLVPTDPADIFNDIAGLRKTATLKVTRKKLLINVSVGRPADNVHFRVHSDPEWSLDCSVIKDKDDGRVYFVTPFMLNHPVILPRLRKVTLATVYSWPGGELSLWPVPIIEETTRIKCWKSERVAYDRAKTTWVAMVWNRDTRDYDVTPAEGINLEPIWPTDKTFTDLLRLGFADAIIDSPEHPYVLRLRGLAE